ncbi:hypothetical protein KXX33_009403 [Aspergillus fumigatus]|nr:hypothetical protein KXX30_005928 [Aspergillus fumigatus]KAH1318212.1 hypothetical protein KXX38_001279 [Aspergillus fumigatus]KAH1351649.1 hypothetical protein KXX33_009403 [Aspergillus fumigatus]KAH1393334.1 hypothetical protein KXX49_001007 [Aspergillus fumigatus]KAH1428543.1 hypothetical protein KXX64_009445 [Aspergillus fumigatus]
MQTSHMPFTVVITNELKQFVLKLRKLIEDRISGASLWTPAGEMSNNAAYAVTPVKTTSTCTNVVTICL